MPNYVSNQLKVYGTDELLNQFKNENIKVIYEDNVEGLDFGAVVPEPTFDSPEEQEKFNRENWYDWRIENWGTKWNSCSSWYELEKEEMIIGFDTAWSPPENWFRELVKKYPNLHFYLTYDEAGMGFMGEMEGRDGVVVDDRSWDMEKDDYIRLGYADESDYDEDNDDFVETKHDMEQAVAGETKND
jgi:hypothetical protein